MPSADPVPATFDFLFIYLIIFLELSFHSRAPCIQVACSVQPPIEDGGWWVGAARMTPTGYIQFPYPAFFLAANVISEHRAN